MEANRLGRDVIGYDINPMAYWRIIAVLACENLEQLRAGKGHPNTRRSPLYYLRSYRENGYWYLRHTWDRDSSVAVQLTIVADYVLHNDYKPSSTF